jgi:hypothetical protein
VNDPANWTDRDATTEPRTPTGNPYDIVRIGNSWASEDLNGNGILDPGEDLNGNGIIDNPLPDSSDPGWGGYYGGGGIDLAVDPVLRDTYVSSTGTAEGGWWFVLNAPNILTLEDGAFLIMSRDNCNLRNGGRLEVQGRSDTDGPSLIVAKGFRIAENGAIPEAAHETSQVRINGTGWVQMDPALRGSGAAFMIGTPDAPGTMPRGEIIIEDQGRLELLSADPVPYLDFGNADPSVNQIIIRDNGELWLPGDPNAMGKVGPDDTVTSLQEMIDMGLITSDTGTLTVSGSNPTVVKAVPSPFTVVELPAVGTDAAIGIDASKTYTHALDFGTGAPTTINGVAFDQGPTANLSSLYEGISSQGYGYTINDTRTAVNVKPHAGNDPSTYADGASAEMLRDMIYFSGANANEGIILTLSDLTPGVMYSVRYYYRPWDPAIPRPISINADGGALINIDIDEKLAAFYLDYTVVPDDSDITLEFICNVDNQGVHLYGITCEEVGLAEEVPQAALIASDTGLTAGFDAAQKDRLESMGYDVTVATGSDVKNDVFTMADAETFDVLVVSESIGSGDVNKLIGVNVPMMHEESYGWSRHYFTAGLKKAWIPVDGPIDIVNDHTIIADAGLSVGPMDFFTAPTNATSDLVSALAPGALNLAQVTIDANDFTLVFAIEQGAELSNGTPAANRVVGFSLPGTAGVIDASVMTDEAWAFFDAAILWLDAVD